MLILYRTSSANNVIGKQKVEVMQFNITLKQSTDVTSPVIRLRVDNDFTVNTVNYAYLEQFKRYYFIKSIERMESNLYALYLECDVLETYKDSILNSQGEIRKPISAGDYNNVSIDVEVRKEIDMYKSDVSVDGQKYIILSSIGG